MRPLASALIRGYTTVFWDFDGVIKESVEVKTQAYTRLFGGFGSACAARVREHHERYGGMSRFVKIPLYLEWAGVAPTRAETQRYCELFAKLVHRAVIDAAWVAGAREYLEANHERQRCVLVTATPQQEIEDILQELGIAAWFREVHGAPIEKGRAIAAALRRFKCVARDALLIGDSMADYEAAMDAGIAFLLRRTELNRSLLRTYSGPQCEDFLDG
jgi:phosphoglycolate phosphatase-like HAD superfamily hydrolase